MSKPLTQQQRRARIKKAIDHTEAAVVALSPTSASTSSNSPQTRENAPGRVEGGADDR